MRANTRLFWVLTGFFFLASIVYIIWTLAFEAQGLATNPSSGQNSTIEWVGTVGLALAGVASALIAFYIGRTHRAQGGELAEDRGDANIDDGDAEQGFFSPWSWWPVALALCAAMLFLGVAVGVWIAVIGVALGVIALVGWTYEYHRRYFGH